MSEGLYIEKGPIIIIPDPLNPNFFQIVRNSDWMQIPEICSFTDFIHWNYAEDYEATIRNCVENGLVPLGNQSEYRHEQIASIKLDHTQIHRIYLHHIDNVSFRMDVVMIANFTVHFYGNSFVKEKQWYRVQGTFRICDRSNFFESAFLNLSVYTIRMIFHRKDHCRNILCRTSQRMNLIQQQWKCFTNIIRRHWRIL